MEHAVVAAFGNYAQRGEDAAKRGGWRLCIKITLLIMENHGIVFLNFCGNPVFVPPSHRDECLSHFKGQILYMCKIVIIFLSISLNMFRVLKRTISLRKYF